MSNPFAFPVTVDGERVRFIRNGASVGEHDCGYLDSVVLADVGDGRVQVRELRDCGATATYIQRASFRETGDSFYALGFILVTDGGVAQVWASPRTMAAA